MTMAILGRQLPPEIRAAKQTLAAARKDALPTQYDRTGRIAAYLFLLAIGGGIGTLLVSLGVVVASDKEFWRAGLTALSVLSGFMIATMVFTGKIDAAKNLDLTELRNVAAKSNFLLLYQIGTLANHVCTLFLMLLAPAIATKWPFVGSSFAVLCLGLFFVSIARSVLIPIQIIELHRFTHAALLREKRDDAKKEAGNL